MASSTARSSNRSKGEGLAVVGRRDEEGDAPDLAGVAGFGELQQPLEGVAALRGGLALAQHHALHVVVDVERTGQGGSPYGSSTWPIVSRERPICHPFLRIMITILIMWRMEMECQSEIDRSTGAAIDRQRFGSPVGPKPAGDPPLP